MEKVFLDIGGTPITTCLDVLLQIPYFKALDDMNPGKLQNSTPENRLFYDRDPTAFRHLLNTLQNVDYDFPKEYCFDLPYWGVEIPNIVVKKTSVSPRVNFFDQEETIFAGSSKNNTRITLHKTIFSPSTFAAQTLHGTHFTGEFEYSLDQLKDYAITEGYFLIPDSYPMDKLHLLTLLLLENNSIILQEFSLHLAQLMDSQIFKCAGWYVFSLPFFVFTNIPVTLHGCDSKFQLKLKINSELKKNSELKINSEEKKLESQLRLNTSKISKYELNMMKGHPRDYVLPVHYIDQIPETGVLDVPVCYLRFILWETDQIIEQVTLLKNKEEYTLSRVDFQLLERQKVNLKKLPKRAGAMYFCSNPFMYEKNSGGIISKNCQLIFPKGTTGTVYTHTFTKARINQGKLVLTSGL